MTLAIAEAMRGLRRPKRQLIGALDVTEPRAGKMSCKGKKKTKKGGKMSCKSKASCRGKKKTKR